MKFLLVTLVCHFIGKMIWKKASTETNTERKTHIILHPAEFPLRHEP